MPVDETGLTSRGDLDTKPHLYDDGESGEPEIAPYVAASSQHTRYIDSQGNFVQETIIPGSFASQGIGCINTGGWVYREKI